MIMITVWVGIHARWINAGNYATILLDYSRGRRKHVAIDLVILTMPRLQLASFL